MAEPKSKESVAEDKAPARLPSLAEPKLAIVPAMDLGEQIVDSAHTFTAIAWNVYSVAATCTATADEGPFSVKSAPQYLVPTSDPRAAALSQSDPIAIEFHPTKHGHHEGSLSVRGDWPDGLTETQTVKLTARARTLDEAPTKTVAEVAAEKAEADQQAAARQQMDDAKQSIDAADRKSGESTKASMFLVASAGTAKDRAKHLLDKQKDGVDRAATAAAAYKKQVDGNPSLMEEFAELALDLGTAGVGGVIAHHLAPLLAHAVGGGHEGNVAVGLDEMVKEGFQDFVEDVFRTKKSDGASSGGDGSGAKDPYFFHLQHETLEDAAESKLDFVSALEIYLSTLAPPHDPNAPARLMDNVAAAMHLAATEAMPKQHEASALQWAAYVARSSNPTTEVEAPAPGFEAANHATDTTDLGKARETSNFKSLTGVLDIRVDGLFVAHPDKDEMNFTGLHPTSARIEGVSNLIAEQLRRVDLKHGDMPLRVSSNGADQGSITRDEAHRVRVSNFPMFEGVAGGRDEAQSIMAAEAIVDQVLSKTLEQWGVKIVTDSAD